MARARRPRARTCQRRERPGVAIGHAVSRLPRYFADLAATNDEAVFGAKVPVLRLPGHKLAGYVSA